MLDNHAGATRATLQVLSDVDKVESQFGRVDQYSQQNSTGQLSAARSVASSPSVCQTAALSQVWIHEQVIHATMQTGGAMRTIPLHRKVLFSLFVVIVFVITVEVACRIFAPAVESSTRNVGSRKFVEWLSELSISDKEQVPLYKPDADLLWVLTPNRVFQGENYHRSPDAESQPITITINKDGYRGPLAGSTHQSSSDNCRRILCLGDSNFFGYPLDDANTFPATLQRVLNHDDQHSEWEVVNGGVPGYTSFQGRRLFEAKFKDLKFDWLFVSFLNNDAWPQPRADKDAAITGSGNTAANWFVAHSRTAQLLNAQLRPVVRSFDFVPRVALNDFLSNYTFLLEQAEKQDAKMLILDYCVYPEYQSYTDGLLRFSERSAQVKYLHVASQAALAMEQQAHLTQFSELTEGVRRRWGANFLQQHPYLWIYAEFNPEHLNEIGTAWLSDTVVKTFLTHPRSVPALPEGHFEKK